MKLWIWREPRWVTRLDNSFQGDEKEKQGELYSLKIRLAQCQSSDPLVSVVIPAFNEEENIVGCLSSLADNSTEYPFEIIVIDNSSVDSTFALVNSLGLRCAQEKIQGSGPARERGHRMAQGKYILLADADCLYPVGWIQLMMKNLLEPGTSAVYGKYSFIPDEKVSRPIYFVYECFVLLWKELKELNRPFLNAYGISMGYIREHGIEVGYIQNDTRGSDGRLCLGLMKLGKVKMVRDPKATVWTRGRTFYRNGKSFGSYVWSSLFYELKNAASLLYPLRE